MMIMIRDAYPVHWFKVLPLLSAKTGNVWEFLSFLLILHVFIINPSLLPASIIKSLDIAVLLKAKSYRFM